MKLSVNKNSFVSNILAPVSKLADNLVLEFETGNKAKTLVTSSDNSVVLIGNTACRVTDEFSKCIIPDCKTFLRLFSGVEKEEITLDIESNTISYKDPTFSFKYHLLDESYIVSKKTISEQKLNQLEFNTTFIITKQKLSEIVKYNSIVPDAEKLYFFTQENKAWVKIGDEQRTNTNEITTEVSTTFTGQPLKESIPLNIQNILLFSFTADEVCVKINHDLKVFKFETPQLSYIISGLVR